MYNLKELKDIFGENILANPRYTLLQRYLKVTVSGIPADYIKFMLYESKSVYAN